MRVPFSSRRLHGESGGFLMGGELRQVYTVMEAAEMLGLSRSTAYHLVAQGELPTVRLGRRLMVTRPTMTALLGGEPPPPSELARLRRTQDVTLDEATPRHRPSPPFAR